MTQSAASSLNVFSMLMESQYWSHDQMQAYQQSQLGQLLQHARATVPFYKSRLDCLFRGDGSIDWSKWDEVPVLTRAEAAEHFMDLQSDAVPQSHGDMNMSSTTGTTGIPLKIRSTWLWHMVHQAADWRSHSWWGLDWSRDLISLDEARPRKSFEINAPWGPPSAGVGKRGIWHFEDKLKPLVDRVAERRFATAPYFYAQCSLAYADALAAQRDGVSTELAGVICSGEGAEPEFRSAIRQRMNAEMFMLYSSKESGRLAYSCGSKNHYHINSEIVLVEILDRDNKPCPPGTEGRIIVTPFMNAAMPLIRYDQGDIAAFGRPCSCGRQLPVLDAPKGRTLHLFTDSDGNVFAPDLGDEYREELGAAFWQFVQTAKGEVTLRYKPQGSFDLARQNAFAKILQSKLPRNFKVMFELIDSFPLTPSGKYLKYINRTADSRPEIDPWKSGKA